jgi:hypothetical protein
MKYKSLPTDVLLYNGISAVLTIDTLTPTYNGPVSLSTSCVVSHRFAGSNGMVLTVKSGLIGDEFHSISGIDVSWLSRFDHEREFLVYDQLLPIFSNQICEYDDQQKGSAYFSRLLDGFSQANKNNSKSVVSTSSLKKMIKSWLPVIVQDKELFVRNRTFTNKNNKAVVIVEERIISQMHIPITSHLI